MEAALIRQGRTLDDGAFVARFVGLLDARHVRYCVIGGEAVNVHAGPGITFGLDLIVEAEDLAGLLADLDERFIVDQYRECSLVQSPRSSLCIHIRTDLRSRSFISRAVEKGVLGLRLPVATLEDTLQGKIWAAMDSSRSSAWRRKDMADIARLLGVSSDLQSRVPQSILIKLG